MSTFGTLLIAALSGLALGIIGVAFRIGQNRNVIPLHISMCMGLAGAIFFGVQMDWSLLAALPLAVWIFVVLNGAGQIVAMHFTRVALGMGPLSPLWSAMNLTFLAVVIYSAIVFGEPVNTLQVAAILAAIGTVLFASQLSASDEEVGEGGKKKINRKFAYSILLLVILISNSIVFIAIKDLGTRPVTTGGPPILAQYTAPVFFVMYLGLALATGGAAWVQGAKPDRLRDLLLLGLMAALGSVLGMLLLNAAIGAPAALVFTISGVMTILTGAIASVLFFGEKMVWAWYATVGMGALALILANIGPLLQ